MIFEDIKLDFKDVLIVPNKTSVKSRREVEINRNFTFKYSNKPMECIPIIAANMHGVGTFSMAEKLNSRNMKVAIHKHYGFDRMLENRELLSNNWVSSGITDEDFERLESFIRMGFVNHVCLDVANGYMDSFVDAVKKLRSMAPDITIMAGNVVTPEMTIELINAGADVVKVGIGPGSVCTTRKVAGVGYPQFSAIMECAEAAHSVGGLICGDGGCQVIGDICKAFGAGADFVMLGGMLSGFVEGEYSRDARVGDKVSFYGMSSHEAQLNTSGEIKEYRASEGKQVQVVLKGHLDQDLQEIAGGIRSACSYTGVKDIKDFHKNARFVRVNQQLNPMFK